MQGEVQGLVHEWEHRALQRKWLGLYALTLAFETPAMLARYIVGLVVAAVLLRLSGHEGNAVHWARLAALGPIAWSALALLTPQGGGWWWRQRLGGRPPSVREREAYVSAMMQVQARTATPLPIPESFFVRDDPRCEAALYGHTLMLSRGALELKDGHLPALLAHQLGHMRGLDAKLTVAVNRLVLKPLPSLARSPRSALGMVASLLCGGLGLRLTAPAWGAVWRAQEYEADRFTASIGWAIELAELLETHALELDHPVPLVSLTNHPHPPVELRIDRLRHGPDPQQPSSPDTGPFWIGEAA